MHGRMLAISVLTSTMWFAGCKSRAAGSTAIVGDGDGLHACGSTAAVASGSRMWLAAEGWCCHPDIWELCCESGMVSVLLPSRAHCLSSGCILLQAVTQTTSDCLS